VRALAVAFVLGANAFAGGGAETEPYQDVNGWIGALADLYATYNFNQPPSGTNQLYQFNTTSGSPSINWVRLALARKPGRVGFRLDAGLGDTANVYFAQDPAAPAHPEAARFFSHVQQAFVSFILPTRRYFAVELGKFNTPVGLEDNETPTNWNYSRSLIFTFCEPTLHTGLRVTWRPIEWLGISLYWINGWNANVLDGSDLRTFAVAATWKPRDGVEVALVYLAGLEHPPTMLAADLSFRNLLDAYVLWSARSWLSLALSADYGNDRARGGVNFWGVAVYARLKPRPWLAFAARGEYFADPDGFTTATPQQVFEGTLTADLDGKVDRLALTARIEYRHDSSTAAVFERPATRAGTQDTMTLALIVKY